MRISIRLVAAFAVVSSLVAFAPRGSATPYWGPQQVEEWLHSPHPAGAPQTIPHVPQGTLSTSYADELALEASYLNTWQVHTAGADFGGIIEGEALQTIIQTDNTSEAIWVWSRYYQVTGDNRYHQNILDAFTYSMSHPAYNEEGGSTSTTGYYRMYNCGWAMRAEEKYRDVYHDTTYMTYGDSCASYVKYHTLDHFNSTFYDTLNTHVLAWAIGNLYNAGVHEGRSDWRSAAFAQARDKVKVWVEAAPRTLGNQTWAMAGGATMWGMLNAYFPEVPDSVAPWVTRYKNRMDFFSDPGDFTNAWDGWYAYGHRAVGLALGDPNELAMHIDLTDYLVSQDGDNDGGIPAKPQDGNNADQSWVSNYMVAFGLSDSFGPTSGIASAIPGANTPVLRIYPNPVSGAAHLALDLRGNRDGASLTIVDVSGRRVSAIPIASSADSRRLLDWSPAGLPSGTYFVLLRTPEGTTAQRVLKLP
jgi:hypothetical protein